MDNKVKEKPKQNTVKIRTVTLNHSINHQEFITKEFAIFLEKRKQ
jgi:hypothetical protein